jgi:nucleotide-binding universal stress UspA family protein
MSLPVRQYYSAKEDFRHERRMAALQEILARVTGKSIELLDYRDVTSQLKLQGSSDKGLHDIPIASIVGSVGRYTDFTRGFLPRHDSDIERWARVKAEVTGGMTGLPPIEVYKIGDAYFVRDGHHRVSVARQLGADHIQAYVIEVRTKVPITPDVSTDDLILKAEYADFLEATHVDEVLPEADLRLTELGAYHRLEDHIQVHRYYMGLDEQREITEDEAVRHWYSFVYLPVVQAIQDRGVLHEFPGRTETDLYLWISEYRYLLEKELGWEIRSDVAATDLARTRSPRPSRILGRLGRRIRDMLTPGPLEDVPSPGTWMESKDTISDCLFVDILIPVSGESEGWSALDQAVLLAECEGVHLNGLHVVSGPTELESDSSRAIREQFEARCQAAGISGRLSLGEGEIDKVILERAVFNDLVVLDIAHPPSSQILARLGSGLRTIIRRCSRPILAVPGHAVRLERLLLAYDGSLKGREALYLSAYFAAKNQWPLTVVCVEDEKSNSARVQRDAQHYLEERKVTAHYVLEPGQPGEVILLAAQADRSSLLLMGGYGFSPLVEMVLGSTVDYILREAEIPVLICQ